MAIWLAFLKKYQYYGVGMKANVWEHSGLDVGKDLDAEAERIGEKLGEEFDLFGKRKDLLGDGKELEQQIHVQPFKGQWGAYAAMGGNESVPPADRRIEMQEVGGRDGR